MFSYLARIGKKRWFVYVAPVGSGIIGTGYLGYHCYGHSIVRDLLAPETPQRRRETINDSLKALIKEVYSKIAPDLLEQPKFFSISKIEPPDIRWFCSSTLDPVSIGSSNLNSGISIGVPNRYNYNKVEELPDYVFQVNNINLFKNFRRKEEKTDIDDELQLDQSNTTHIDRSTPDGKLYADSLILSENGKQFSVAKELLYCDTNRITFMMAVVIISCMIATSSSRAAVNYFKLKDRHLSNRVPFYMLCSYIGFWNYRILSSLLDSYYDVQSEKRAISYGQSYKDGAIEYFEKTLQRNKALRNIFESMKAYYDEDGNVIEPFYRRGAQSISKRIEKLKQVEQDVEK